MKVTEKTLIGILISSNAKEITLSTETEVKMNKRNNPLIEKNVTKITTGTFGFGGSYGERVNEALQADGSTATYTPKPLAWGSWMQGAEGIIIEHTGKDGVAHNYLRYYKSDNAPSVTYKVDGSDATEEEVSTIKEFSPKKSGSAAQAALGLTEEKQVLPMAVMFENIKSLTIDGQTYELQ